MFAHHKSKWFIGTAGVLCVLAFAYYLLFHGYFDRGHFVTENVDWNSTGHVALIAERSDDQALSGNQYFIVIADHALSSTELRRAYYHDGVTFRAGTNCLTTAWKDSKELTISCNGTGIHPEDVAVEKSRIGDVVVSYVHIPQISQGN